MKRRSFLKSLTAIAAVALMPPVMIRESCRVKYDLDALAYFRMYEGVGGSFDLNTKYAVNSFVKEMKEDGIWDKMCEIYIPCKTGNSNVFIKGGSYE